MQLVIYLKLIIVWFGINYFYFLVTLFLIQFSGNGYLYHNYRTTTAQPFWRNVKDIQDT